MRPSDPDFGPHVVVVSPGDDRHSQGQFDHWFSVQEHSEFGTARVAFLLRPGRHELEINLGYYTQVLGLGRNPGQVIIDGEVTSEPVRPKDNATCNFWRGFENLTVKPRSGVVKWAVAQATPVRRVHIQGDLRLSKNQGWSSGGFLADSLIDGEVDSGTQQQWFSRNCRWGSWKGFSWNMVFAGVEGAPEGSNWPNPPHTSAPSVDLMREKPYLFVDQTGDWKVFVPDWKTQGRGPSWTESPTAGSELSLDRFYIAREGIDTAATLNRALAEGKHLLFTPGIYPLDEALRVEQARTILLGLGFATLRPETGTPALQVVTDDGVIVAGLVVDAGPIESQHLVEIGAPQSHPSPSGNPPSLHDLFFRVGGATPGSAVVSLVIRSPGVVGDHFWIWRADHGLPDTVGWLINPGRNGLVVEGDDVSLYGLFVEHYQGYQTLWKGERGSVLFYQCEIPYDVPDGPSWTDAKHEGWAAYRVDPRVHVHRAAALGVYCFFRTNPSLALTNAVEAPSLPRGAIQRITTVSLGGGTGTIRHLLDGRGAEASPGNIVARLDS